VGCFTPTPCHVVPTAGLHWIQWPQRPGSKQPPRPAGTGSSPGSDFTLSSSRGRHFETLGSPPKC